MKRISIGFWAGVVAAFLHLCLALFACHACWHSRSSTAGLAFLPFFFLDAPLLFLTPFLNGLFGKIAPLIQFGLLGSALWFLIPWQIGKFAVRFFPRRPQIASIVSLIVAIPILYVAFMQLAFFTVKRSIQGERPAELKGVLNSASTDILTGKAIFSEEGASGISGIRRMHCRPGAGTELVFALPRSVVFLDDNYREQHRISFADQVFKTIEPLDLDGKGSCRLLATRFQKGTYLLDLQGKEIRNYGPVDRVRFGDIDGDGKQELAIFDGSEVRLLDGDGKTRWKHPALAIGHLEMADVRGNGKAEILCSNAANAWGATEFTILDAAGAVARQAKITSKSYEFALIHWPRRETPPYLLLTEENRIRIVDLQGEAVLRLDAPGCRPFGAVSAVTVKFAKGEPEYLAVKKSLHPDLAVLYVYNAEGKLANQKTDIARAPPALAAVPAKEPGVEKLLVGAVQKSKVQVLEYSLSP
jgi:hypothetical protein